ncbi:MAG: hypothetical protein OEU32_12255 [Acidimicrobiia bacterium]|nr:hypothetical protein [Acidimicrobiia bacterium]
MRLRRKLVALGAMVVLGAAGCSGGLDRDGAIDSFADDFDVSTETATCVVDDLIGNLGEDRVDELAHDGVPTDDEVLVLFESLDGCGSGASELVDDADIASFAADLGVTDAVARCVFDDLGDELAQLGALDAEVDGELVNRVFESITNCGG